MPQAAIAAVGNFLLAVFGGYSAAATAAAYLVATVFVYAATNYLINRALLALQSNKRSRGGLGSGAEINYYDSGAPIRIVYGTVRTGGMETIPPFATGVNREMLHKVLTLAACEVTSYIAFAFDSTIIPAAAVRPVTFSQSDGLVSSGDYKDHAWIRAYKGTTTDSVDRILMEASSSFYGTSRGRGIAKLAVRFKYNDKVYRNIPQITARYNGKAIYDPRLDVTPGASPTNAAYIAFSSNPALVLCDYLMSITGGEFSATDIDWTTVVTAANYCDGLVNIPGALTEKRYTFNGIVFATDEFTDNLRTIVDAMLGRLIYRDGKWRVYAGSWQTPTFTVLKEDWLKGGLSIKFEQGFKKRFNRMHCWFVDPQRDYQRVECPSRSNPTYVTADGGVTVDAETEQLNCNRSTEAERKAEMLLRQSRNQIIVVGRLPPRFQNIALWDTGTIVFDDLGWASKTFRCMGFDLNPAGEVDVVFCEEQSGDWTDMAAAEYGNPSEFAIPDTNVTTPSEPTSFSAAQQINGTLLFTIGQPIIKPYGTRYQIIRSTNSLATVGTVIWEGDATPVPLVCPTSPHWYFSRCVANSDVSPFQPNTFGLYAFARPEADATNAAGVFSDPGFDYSDQQGVYWLPASGYQGNFALSVTGGLTGGKVTITSTTDLTANLQSGMYALPTSPYMRLLDRNISLGFRYRMNSYSTGDIGLGPGFQIKAWTGVGTPNHQNTTVTNGLPNQYGIVSTAASAGLGVWVSQSNVTSIVPKKPTHPTFIDATSYPYIVAFLGTINASTTQWEIDQVWADYV
jgi:hypothetical protein